MKSKSPARATVASLIGCCAGQEVGFPGDGIAEDYNNDNDSFVVPRALERVQSNISGGSANAKKQQKPPMKTPIKNDGFGSAVKKQQQRNRFTSSPLIGSKKAGKRQARGRGRGRRVFAATVWEKPCSAVSSVMVAMVLSCGYSR